MEMEAKTPQVAKKLWRIIRIVFFMLRKGISKSKIISDFNLFFKRGNKLAGKAIGDLIYHHHSSASFSCRSGDALAVVQPREYEFSCSNSPAFPLKRHHRRRYEDVSTAAAVQRVLEMMSHEAAVEASPVVLPGFGKSPAVKQLRITDSPFPVKDDGGDCHVDAAAEEFIEKFYKELKKQKNVGFESPFHNLWGW